MHTQSRHLVRLMPVLLAVLLAACGGRSEQVFSTINSGLNPGGAPIAPQPNEAQRRVAAPTSAAAAPLTLAEAQQNVAAEPPTPSAPPRPVTVNPFTRASDDHLSTFAIDVDTAAYTAAQLSQ